MGLCVCRLCDWTDCFDVNVLVASRQTKTTQQQLTGRRNPPLAPPLPSPPLPLGQAEAEGRPPQYDRTWRDADPAEVQRRIEAGEPYTVRFKVGAGRRVEINDMVRGAVAWDADATVGDFILLRSSGMPVYNFCVAGK